MTVLGADVFEPAPVEAHEIAKPFAISIPRMLNEGREAHAQSFGHGLFARRVERAGHQQGASVVVDTIAVQTIGHGMDCMLEQSGVIAHELEMIERSPAAAGW